MKNMHIFLQFIFIKSLFVIVKSTMKPFIVDGDDAKITDFPHSAHIAVDCKSSDPHVTGAWVCGASVVTQEAGLTAAHCLHGCNKYSRVTLSAGHIKPLEGVVATASSFIVHSDFRKLNTNGGYDIALVRFKTPLNFSSNIQRVVLIENLKTPKEAYVAGWGIVQENPHITTDHLKKAKQYLMTNKECINTLEEDIPVGTICAFNKLGYASLGDSGSALIVKEYIQIGIVSYKIPDARKDLVVYTDVRYFYKWIQTQLNILMCL